MKLFQNKFSSIYLHIFVLTVRSNGDAPHVSDGTSCIDVLFCLSSTGRNATERDHNCRRTVPDQMVDRRRLYTCDLQSNCGGYFIPDVGCLYFRNPRVPGLGQVWDNEWNKWTLLILFFIYYIFYIFYIYICIFICLYSTLA